MTVRVVENPGWLPELLNQEQARVAIGAAAEETKGEIINAVPVHSGWYKDYFESSVAVRPENGLLGAEAEITTGSSIWHIIEYGSVNNPPYAPLRRGVENAGLRWESG